MNMEQYQNDISLLRPFNLEAAKNGEDIRWSNISNPVTFIGVANNGMIVYDSGGEIGSACEGNFRMKPLCWLEGRPVYKGDVLWHQDCWELIVSGIAPFNKPSLYKEWDNLLGYNIDCLTWTKPKQKVKRKIWINVYPEGVFSYLSAEQARVNASSRTVATCVETEIDYKV